MYCNNNLFEQGRRKYVREKSPSEGDVERDLQRGERKKQGKNGQILPVAPVNG